MSDETNVLMQTAYERFAGTGMYLTIFIVAILYVLTIVKKKDVKHEKKLKAVLGYYSIIVFILNMNPLFATLMETVNGEEVYWRVYWLLPIAITIPFLFTQYIFKNPKIIGRIVIGLVAVFLLVSSGQYMYTEDKFIKVNNYYKIPDDVFDILKVASEDEEGYKKLAGPLEFEIYTRQYDGTIILAEPRSFTGEYSNTSIVTYLNSGDVKKISDKAKAIKCNYLVMNHASEKSEDNLVNYGFEILRRNNTYTLYKLNEM